MTAQLQYAAPIDAVRQFRDAHPDVTRVDVLIPDAQGVLRGLRLGVDALEDLMEEGVGFPGSLYATDITGSTVEETGLGFEDGDADRPCIAVPGTLVRVPWAERPTGQVLIRMTEADGSRFYACPRSVLEGVVERYRADGLTPVVGIELEFYLVDRERDERGLPQPPLSPATGRRQSTVQVYGLEELDEFDHVIDDMLSALKAQSIPADCVVSEYAPGQYEINLDHMADAVRACDQALLFKRAIKGVARRHGIEATFMAKPYPQWAGNGFHIHLSVLDRDGRNIFADPDPMGNETLRHAIGGLKETMVDGQALFAPHQNSYRRFRANAYAPLAPTWGVNNRSTSLRIPQSGQTARRVEHRVAGADANPYLVMAAVLAGAHHGIANRIDPGRPIEGNAYESEPALLTSSWLAAVDTFGESGVFRDYLGDAFVEVFLAIKRSERETFHATVTPLEYDWYLTKV